MALFSNKNKKIVKDADGSKHDENEIIQEGDSGTENLSTEQVGSTAFSGTGGADTHKVLSGFYISEKASIGSADSQYTFRVFKNANKSEVKKEVSKLFNVKIKSVKILNMPEKRRDFGKHPGVRSGFKKAIVILEDGYTIGQAKP